MTKFGFPAIGTSWVIDIKDPLSEESEDLLLKKIIKRIDIFDKDYSRFRDDSLVTKMSKESGEFVLPSDAHKMVSLYKEFYDATDSLVTPLIGQVLVDAGYDSRYSLEEKILTKPKKWEDTMSWQEPKLTIKEPVLLDFGAGGKGYLVDIVSELLETEGMKSYCVDAGGDIRQRGEDGEVLKVGLEHPDDAGSVIGVIPILNKSICGSAGNRRKWGNFHHIINPETLSSANDVLAVWAIAESTILADLVTTALFFVPPEKINNHKFEYLIVFSDYSIKRSLGFNAEMFI